jgi:hypothetical protein
MIHEVTCFEDTKSILVLHCLAIDATLTHVVISEVLDTLVVHEHSTDTLVWVLGVSSCYIGFVLCC